MGICLTSNYKGAPSLEGSYSMLHRIRSRLAAAWDKEFGDHYKRLTTLWLEDHFTEFNARTAEILSQERFTAEDLDLIEFWFMSDAGGKLNYKTCKKLADLLTFIMTDKTEPFVQICLRYQMESKND